MKILAVDDDPIILELLTEVLRAAGFGNLTVCNSAAEALAEIDRVNVPFDCFLLDIQMPEVDGIELTTQIRRIDEYRNSPILMITAMSDRTYIDRAFNAGASDYITKPFDVLEIHSRLRLIQSLLSEYRSLEERNPTPQLNSPASTVTAADLEKRLSLRGIDGFIDFLALENYLLQISRVSLYDMIAFGIVVPDMARAFRASSVFEFEAAVSDFAEAISECLKPDLFFASHAGEGRFVCVLTNASNFAPDAFETRLSRTVREMDLHFCDGRAISQTPVVGESISLELTASRDISDALFQALRSAEARALCPVPQERAPSSKLKRLLGIG
ncbi:MAG: diguanylate cyclase [Roseovarius sp. BRH_c41]|uniref:response regulator n=1 Tax=Roseovarius sp. BRH_c41 TaxID=1629709 RepID=UPI0005F18CD7|nr:response regulator [Roseovarius sp. BRH_c41]KJS40905.1 MAG: diguanylate cyclase [Roseovarius sp. BRH_c41]